VPLILYNSEYVQLTIVLTSANDHTDTHARCVREEKMQISVKGTQRRSLPGRREAHCLSLHTTPTCVLACAQRDWCSLLCRRRTATTSLRRSLLSPTTSFGVNGTGTTHAVAHSRDDRNAHSHIPWLERVFAGGASQHQACGSVARVWQTHRCQLRCVRRHRRTPPAQPHGSAHQAQLAAAQASVRARVAATHTHTQALYFA
jgi:hypothetical protein